MFEKQVTIGQQVSLTFLALLRGRFVVAVSFADGNVCANGAWDRVIRVVRWCGKSDAEALRDDARFDAFRNASVCVCMKNVSV